ncbi:uncharacterized protein K489DRAFT_362685 [Dissoconium aciculare CBS 342.82]|uniref:Azaphilone pigments biosynthesis cluster protein L N-terminal domain-containing protein n=1 Tax=Dissoconium aciculare CBS 342.82 TaxID=1314786 RepID=A0A6J3LW82_9PEZI|nr:uncharacterized protein K489DRAFT_362685 [Dissoconium aciculare CBS 342.82]KAF1820030.1 hypothetical protein K489DRAFT_362685 [Dissoconium aciculare CBS 342.82]
MADPLSVAAGVVGLVVPAVHGLKLLKADLDRIVDAPAAVARLRDDVASLDGSLAQFKDIDQSLWASLGPAVLRQSATALQSCESVCDTIRGDLHRWTKRSTGGSLSWRDRVNVGFFKEQQLKAYASQLQTQKLTFTMVVGTANLYSALCNTRLTEELRGAIVIQRQSIEAAGKTIHSDVANLQRALEQASISSDAGSAEYEEDQEAAATTLEGLQETLRISQALLAELQKKAQEQDVARVSEHSGARTTITFGNSTNSMQVGYNHAPITWNSKP